ncbi:MAG: tetrahydromethanopterin S-methyltransferase subunit A [Methanosarcinaceae archaeon]|nr:tetrahydromethanopterin S-methyltransferase subunit A [Methanosarcinaceae archaeon]
MEPIAPEWPVVKGDYVIGTPDSRVAVVTLASTIEPYLEASIWGSCKTENLGVEKIVANMISNSNIRYLLICGGESRGHLAGQTLFALHQNGIDENGRIIGSNGAIPFIENIPEDAIDHFQRQVELIEYIGLTDIEQIHHLVDEYKNKGTIYDEDPMVVGTAKKKHTVYDKPVFGDIIISNDVMIDALSGVVYDEECI